MPALPTLPRVLLLLPIALGLLLSAGCPRRTVVVDGRQVSYEEAATEAFGSAQAAYQAGEYARAAEGLEAFLAQYADADQADEARYLLARSYEQLDRIQDARATWAALLAEHPLSPRAPEARLALGVAHLRLGEYADALQVLRPAYDSLQGEQRLAAARALSEAAVGLEDWTAAVRWLSEVGDLARDPAVQAEIDAALLDLVDSRLPPVALAQLEQELSPDAKAYPLVILKLGRLHYHLRDYRRAKERLETYLSRWPDGPLADQARELSARIERLSRVRPEVVGVILPLSGRFKPFGDAVLRGIGMSLDVEPGTASRGKVTLVIRDSKGDPEEAARVLEALVLEEQAVAIIGPLLSNTAPAAAAKAEELGVPLLTLSREAGLTELGPYVFRNALTDQAQAEALVAYAVDTLGAKRFGILYPNHPYGIGMMNAFWDALSARDLEVRAVERYDHDQTTFGGTIKRMVGRYFLQYREEYMQASRRVRDEIEDPYRRRKALEKVQEQLEPVTDFDVLFIPDGYKTVGLIAPALAVEDVITNVCDQRDLERIRKTTGKDDLATVRLLGTNTWNHPDLVVRGGKYVRCSVFVDGFFAASERKETKAFVDAYRQTHGPDKTPGYLEAFGYDTAAIVRAVVEKSAPADRSAFREALLQVQAFPGVTGATSFTATGEAVRPPFYLTVDKDQIVEVAPEPAPTPQG